MPDLSRLAPMLFVLLWSSAFIAAKLGMPDAEPLSFMFVRFVLVAGAFTGLAWLRSAPWPTTWTQAGHIAWVGVLVHAIYLSGVFVAIARGLPAGLAALIVGLQPILTALIAGRALGEHTGSKQWLGLALGLIGVALVVHDRTRFESVDPLAVGFCVISLITISIGTIHQKRYCADMNLLTGSAIQAGTACVLTGLGAWLFESFRITWSVEFTVSLLWLSFVVSLGAFSLLMAMIRRGEAVKVASLFYLTPPTAALLAWVFFGERLNGLGIAGIAVAAIGVALVVRRPAA